MLCISLSTRSTPSSGLLQQSLLFLSPFSSSLCFSLPLLFVARNVADFTNGANVANGADVAVNGAKVAVNGTNVAVNGTNVAVNGAKVVVNGANVAVNGAKVAVNGANGAVNGADVHVSAIWLIA